MSNDIISRIATAIAIRYYFDDVNEGRCKTMDLDTNRIDAHTEPVISHSIKLNRSWKPSHLMVILYLHSNASNVMHNT